MMSSQEGMNDDSSVEKSAGGPQEVILGAEFWEVPRSARADLSPGSVDAWQLALAREAQEFRRRGDDEGLRLNRMADALREAAFDRLVLDLGNHGLGDYADALIGGDYSGMRGSDADDGEG